MSNKDLEIALRIKADLADGQRAIEQFSNTLEDAGNKAQAASDKVNKTTGRQVASTVPQLQAQTAAVAAYERTIKGASITAGQYKQAMQQLPMQITDITTSLVSGMPIWMVAVQQGGQLRDSFGGWGNAGRALLGTLNPLTLAIGAAAAAVAATALAYHQGTQEVQAYNQALIMTGNIAGTTTAAMGQMAADIDDVSGTESQAAEALAQIAATGKFTERQMKQIGLTSVQMANTIGQSVEATIDDFRRLAEDPVKGIANLNEKYHFLTLEVYSQIAALQAQGRESEALEVATDALAAAQAARMDALADNLNWIEKGLGGVKKGLAEVWDGFKGVFRENTLDDLERALAGLEQLRELPDYYVQTPGLDENIQRIKAQIAAKKAEAEQAKKEGEQREASDRAIAAAQKVDVLEASLLDKATRRTEELKKYRALLDAIRAGNPNDDRLAPPRVERNIAAIESKYADAPKKKTDADRASEKQAAAYAALNRQISDRIVVLNAANEAEQKLTDTQRFSEKVLASLKEGTQAFTEEQKTAIRSQLDLLAAAERASQARADDDELGRINERLLATQGQQAEAAAAQLEQQYGALLLRLDARGDVAGAKMVRELIDVETARARLAELQAEIERVFSDQARKEASLQTQVETGLVSEVEARRQIVALYAETAGKVEKLIPEMERLAEVAGDKRLVENVKDMRGEVDELKNTASDLELAFKNAFESGLSNSIQGLAKGTMSLKDAAVSFATTLSDAMLRMASDKIANQAFTGLTSMFDGVAAGAAQAQTAMTAVETTKVATDATMLASTEATLATQTATSTAAAAETTAAWTPASIAASIGSWGTAAAIGLAAVVAALAYKTFADGGQVRGPGTTTSDSIPVRLSDQEFVTRAAVVTQPGALSFLHDFNRRGMVALSDWSGAAHHATGGLAGIPAPDMPAPMLQTTAVPMPGAAGETTLKNNIDLHVYDDPQRIADQAFNTRSGRDAFLVMLARDPGKVRSILKI